MGGINQFIGRLDPSEHPNGPNWYRINDPCLTFQKENAELKRIDNVVAEMSGPGKAYRKFVDVYIPQDCHVEIRVLDKSGKLFEVYDSEIKRIKPDRIIIPNIGVGGGA